MFPWESTEFDELDKIDPDTLSPAEQKALAEKYIMSSIRMAKAGSPWALAKMRMFLGSAEIRRMAQLAYLHNLMPMYITEDVMLSGAKTIEAFEAVTALVGSKHKGVIATAEFYRTPETPGVQEAIRSDTGNMRMGTEE